MKVGDRVRLLRGTEEGKITRLLERSLVEVEIEDGFAIPVLQSELVVVSADESTSFDMADETGRPAKTKNIKKISPSAPPNSLNGFFAAIIPLNDRLSSIYLLNFTKDDLLVLANEVNSNNEERTILSEKVFNMNFVKITERNLDHINSWLPISFMILSETAKWAIPNRPEKIVLNIKAKHFQKETQLIPQINKKGYLIPLNQSQSSHITPLTIDAEKLKNSFYESAEETKHSTSSKFSDSEIDLHIESIDPNYEKLPKDEILRIQLATFESKLDQAIMAGLDEVVFVHGVGNGILKNKIHKILSDNAHIQFFKDAKKEKFGYGATLVKIK
ncbi:Smr/MutS family protein [Marivirga sp. S37H4]|uniref:Smr/MutS family protein n=1 Tax=Marivirga aurantiaca TaxID=2802615 RepID=A0A935C9S6_9BACT|nr:Smr/MutS family protein [Marivirga aurantiaca]MBK6266336.1 Smr/MutS family protein [Marivirga aurantiaca]